MSRATQNLMEAQSFALSIRPKAGGFPYLAEALRQAGVRRNFWYLPSCQSVYLTELGPVVNQGEPLAKGLLEIAPFDRDALIRALRTDQEGKGTFAGFLESAWRAGVVSYEVDFAGRKVIYRGAQGEEYTESYPPVEVKRP